MTDFLYQGSYCLKNGVIIPRWQHPCRGSVIIEGCMENVGFEDAPIMKPKYLGDIDRAAGPFEGCSEKDFWGDWKPYLILPNAATEGEWLSENCGCDVCCGYSNPRSASIRLLPLIDIEFEGIQSCSSPYSEIPTVSFSARFYNYSHATARNCELYFADSWYSCSISIKYATGEITIHLRNISSKSYFYYVGAHSACGDYDVENQLLFDATPGCLGGSNAFGGTCAFDISALNCL